MDKVPSRRAPPVREEDSEGVWEDIDKVAEGSGEPEATKCTWNWKAAAADEKKRMWGIFEETGIFVSACRHSLILWFSDMIWSGEL